MRAEPRSRRHFLQASLALAGLGLLAGCASLAPAAQRSPKLHRIGYLSLRPESDPGQELAQLRQALGALGYAEDRDLVVDSRSADYVAERLPALAADLVRLPADVIVARGTVETVAAKQATATIPIVMQNVADPVGSGLVASLARPGGNVTGFTTLNGQLEPKRLQLLKEAAPSIARVAVFWDATNPALVALWPNLEASARTLSVQLISFPVRGPGAVGPEPPVSPPEVDAVLMFGAPFSIAESKTIGAFAARNRLPGMFAGAPSVDAGGLMAYVPATFDSIERAALTVDKILKGARPADLPVEQPTTFAFAINLKTARELGLTIPQSVLSLATRVIE